MDAWLKRGREQESNDIAAKRAALQAPPAAASPLAPPPAAAATPAALPAPPTSSSAPPAASPPSVKPVASPSTAEPPAVAFPAVAPPAAAKKSAAAAAAAKPAAAKPAKPPTLEQERRRLGDAVKARINFQKYAIAATCHATVDLTLASFAANIVPHAACVTPAAFSAASEVVVARIQGADKMGDAFGKSKIVGGSRVQHWAANEGTVEFYPAEARAEIWWTMGGAW
jgi:hypothetical protein